MPSFKESFDRYVRRYDRETVKEWRKALRRTGKLKGWHVTASDREGDIISNVLSRVELYLRSNYKKVTKDLVGIDSHMQNVIELLNLGSPGGNVIGIHGMSGIGKTTIANAVYDMVSTRFTKRCFLENVSRTLSKDDGITILQNSILSSVLGKISPVESASEGVNMMINRVHKYKIIIVFDDVDENFSFDKVFGKLGDYFNLESRFIITTKNTRTLEFFPDYKSYEVEEMSTPDALQLFCKHAYHPKNLPKEDLSLPREFVKLAGGLPLALEVIGSLLINRNLKFWEEQLTELRKLTRSNDKVRDILMISYKELNDSQQQIFLDISCIFVGENKDWPFYMWADSKLSPQIGITTLISRSLVKVNEKNQFRMHDLLRDLGRYIVVTEDVDHPWNRSRIWEKNVVVDMLENNKGTDRVKILRVNVGIQYDLTSEAFKNLSGLRYLEVICRTLTGDFSQIPNLRWFGLSCFGRIPDNLSMKQCVILDLSLCHVTYGWRGWEEIKEAGKLKVLNLSLCEGLHKDPHLSSCASLEILQLKHSQIKGHLDIGNLKKLKRLELHDSRSITEIRGDFGLLQNLKEFVLDDVSISEAPSGIEDVPTSLKQLTISCSTVPNLLDLKKLEKLSFRFGKPDIPEDLQQLSMLKTLDISRCYSEDFTTLHQVDLPQSLN
ncbi:Disease resistance protein L6 [Linum perenne]